MPHGYSDPSKVMTNTWRSDAVRLYRNWLSFMAERKSRALEPLCCTR